jgi:PDZ domain-containing protein
MTAGATLGGWVVELPYYAFSPGPVGDAVDAVRVLGDVPVYPPRGELLMLTVSVQQVNVFEAATAVADPTVDLVRSERIRRPGETDEDFTRRTLEAMDTSVETAVLVALNRLGIEVTTDGVQVVAVVEGFPAATVLEPGDVIRAVAGDPVRSLADLSEALDGLSPGDLISIDVERGGSIRSVEVRLGESPEEPGRPLIGVQVRNHHPTLPVTLEPGNIGGPSAGMMYTLAVIDVLTEGDLSGGRVVAGTGTIRPDGTVGPVGGVRQKVVAAEAAGAEVMLVPEDNFDEASGAPRGSMELVPVADVDQALEYLGFPG